MEFSAKKLLQQLRGQTQIIEQDQKIQPVAYAYYEHIPCYDIRIPIIEQIQVEIDITDEQKTDKESEFLFQEVNQRQLRNPSRLVQQNKAVNKFNRKAQQQFQ